MIDLAQFVRPGDTILIHHGTAEPRSLVEALIEQRHALRNIRVLVGSSFTGLFRPEHADALSFIGFGGIAETATLTKAGAMDVLPIHLGMLPHLISSGRLDIDVVFVSVGEPDADGNHSLGLTADYVQAGIARARIVLGEQNPRVPFTFGDTLVDRGRIDAIVVDDRPLIEVLQRSATAHDRAIAALVAERVPDGATLQIGVGTTPDAVLAGLRDVRDIGVHSGLMSDAMLDLVEAGAITNLRKEIDTGTIVTGALLGTDRLYQWAHRNPTLQMRPLTYTHEPRVLGRLGSLFAINSALEVDLSGQVNAEMVGGRYAGAIGGQGAFVRAAITSDRGRSIITLPSTAAGATVSRIVARLADGVVTTPRCDADLIVTEHGVADLRGASLRQRAERLLAIADPRHRDELARGLPLRH